MAAAGRRESVGSAPRWLGLIDLDALAGEGDVDDEQMGVLRTLAARTGPLAWDIRLESRYMYLEQLGDPPGGPVHVLYGDGLLLVSLGDNDLAGWLPSSELIELLDAIASGSLTLVQHIRANRIVYQFVETEDRSWPRWDQPIAARLLRRIPGLTTRTLRRPIGGHAPG